MRTKMIVATLVMLLISSSLVFSQTWDNAKGIGLTGSLVKFAGGDVDRAALGYYGGLTLRYGPSPYVMFDLNMNYGSFQPTEKGSSLKKEADSPYRTFLLPIIIDVKVTPSPEARIKPYLSLGWGVLVWDLRNVSGSDLSFFGDQKLRWGIPVYDETQKDPFLKGGLGFETFLTSNLALDIQGGVMVLANSNPKDNVGYDDENSYDLWSSYDDEEDAYDSDDDSSSSWYEW